VSYMRFCIMDVGQGSANYIELREDMGDSLQAAAIVDIGSEQWKTEAGSPSTDWIADQLKMMIGGAALDTVIFSHSDSDHVNLVPDLLEYFDKPSNPDPDLPVLEVKEVIYGGSYAKYKKPKQKKNWLSQIVAYHPDGNDDILVRLDGDYSSFDDDDPADWEPLATVGGQIELWALTANTTGETSSANPGKHKWKALPDGGFSINTRSIVIAAKFAGKTIIATGDATGLTLAHCNVHLAKAEARDKLTLPAFMLTLPHHGSDTTTYDLTGSAHGSTAAKKVVEDFSKYVKADTISGSAGEKSTYKHPSANVIYDLGRYTLVNPKFIDPALVKTREHFYTAYFFNRTLTVTGTGGKAPTDPKWPLFDWFYTVRSQENLYTTDYALDMTYQKARTAYPYKADEEEIGGFSPMPPAGISWGFIVASDGTTRLEVVYERTSAHADYWAAVEAVHGPLPPSRWVVVRSAPLDDGDAPEPPADAAGPAEPPDNPPPPPPPPTRLRQFS
jgi:beta-lactamase superfamily II metal-dependent hydrolase